MLATMSRAASLSGLVVDPMEARIPGATITLTIKNGTLDPLKATSDTGGRFAFEGIASGTFDLLVQMTGYMPRKQNDIRVDIGDVELTELVLSIGEGCPSSGGTPSTRRQRILFKIKHFFAPINRSDVTICQ